MEMLYLCSTVTAVVAAIPPPLLGPMEQLYQWIPSLWSTVTAVVSPPAPPPPPLGTMEQLYQWILSLWSTCPPAPPPPPPGTMEQLYQWVLSLCSTVAAVVLPPVPVPLRIYFSVIVGLMLLLSLCLSIVAAPRIVHTAGLGQCGTEGKKDRTHCWGHHGKMPLDNLFYCTVGTSLHR